METLLKVVSRETIPSYYYDLSYASVNACSINRGIRLYRSAKRDDWHVSTRHSSKIFLESHPPPQFFSSWQVAALYSSDDSYFHTYVIQRGLSLLHISGERDRDNTLKFLLDQYVSIPENTIDRAHVRRFLYVFGYKLDEIFKLMTDDEKRADLKHVGYNIKLGIPTTFQEYFKQWAISLLKEYPQIFILANSVNGTYPLNRFSASKYDHTVFENIFKVTHERIHKAFNGFDGIRVAPIKSGMMNTQYPLNMDDIFPEEIFLRLYTPMNPPVTPAIVPAPAAAAATNAVINLGNTRKRKRAANTSNTAKVNVKHARVAASGGSITRRKTVKTARTKTVRSKSATLPKPNVTGAKTIRVKRLAPQPATPVEYVPPYKYTEKTDDINVLESFYQAKDTAFFTKVSYPAINYIFLYTRVYSKLVEHITQSLNNIGKSTHKSPTNYILEGLSFARTTYKALRQILQICGSVIDDLLSFDAHLFEDSRIPTEANNPYYKEEVGKNGKKGVNLQANLYTYTVLSSVIKRSIGGLHKLYQLYFDEKMYIDLSGASTNEDENSDISGTSIFTGEFTPVVSGGALFGLYTTGKSRRLTKDVDVKIIMKDDKPINGDEVSLMLHEYNLMLNDEADHRIRLTTQETNHWILNMINYTWMTLLEYIFSELAGKKLYAYASKINSFGKMQIKNEDYLRGGEPLVWELYADSSPNLRNLNNQISECDRYIQKYCKVPSFTITTVFDSWLKEVNPQFGIVVIDSYEKYNKILKELLTTKRDLRGDNSPMNKEMITDINKIYKEVSNLFNNNNDFDTYAKDVFEKRSNEKKPTISYVQYQIFKKFNSALQNKIYKRPNPMFKNKAEYKIGFFTSLFINKEGDGQDKDKTYGLIDFTYDTHYSTFGTFTSYAGIKEFGTRNVSGIHYGSSFWFIHESDKLNTICNRTVYPGDNKADVNPQNSCSPNKLNRESKQKKYAERYRLVREFFIGYIKHLLGLVRDTTRNENDLIEGFKRISLANSETETGLNLSLPRNTPYNMNKLIDILEHATLAEIEMALRNKYNTKQVEFDTDLYNFVQHKNRENNEYMVGAGRRA